MSIRGIFPIDKWDFKSASILAGLPPEDLEFLMLNKTELVYKKGETVFKEGVYPAGIFFINSGKVKKFKVDPDGREQIIYIANQGELIGFHAILAEDTFVDSATAIEESVISFISKDIFIQVLNNSPEFGRRLLKTLSHEFAVLANSLTLFTRKSVRERLALQLVVLREKYKINFEPGTEVEIDMSRDDMAGLVGATRENIVRVLSEFKKDGIIKTKGRKIYVCDVKKLITIADYK